MSGGAGLKEERVRSKSLLLIGIRTVLCCIALAAAVVVKLAGGELYARTATWFYDNYNNSIFSGNVAAEMPFTDPVTIKENSVIPNHSEEDKTEKRDIRLRSPVSEGKITSGFGKRTIEGKEEYHKGIDISADEGQPVFAAISGEIRVSGEDESYGKYIVIDHGDGLRTLYAHCSRLLVKSGGRVKAGAKIALAGKTGQALGSHLHFEVLINDKNTDPVPLLPEGFGVA